jgi:hypothetical protein
VQGLGRVFLDVLRPDLVEELLALALDVDAAQMVVVEPALESREVVLGARLRRVSGIGRKVIVDSVGRGARLLHHHRGEGEDRQCDDCCEGEIDEGHRPSARDPGPTESADQWIEEQGDEQRYEEEEENVTHRSGHRPHQQQEDRQQYELRPARDLDRYRRGRRHGSDGNRGTGDNWKRAPQSGPRPAEELGIQGNLALPIWEEPRQFDKVPRDMPSSRPTRRRRVERRQARATRRARLVALLVVLAAVFIVAIALTAFAGRTTAPMSAIVPRQSQATVAQSRPTTEIVAQRGQVRLQLPISQSRLTAIGYHSAGDGALSLQPVGHQANEGLVQRVVHGILGGGGGSPKWYQLAGGGTSALDVGAPIGSDVYAPVDGTVVAIRPFILEGKTYGSEIDIQPQNAPSVVVAVTQLVADPALTVGTPVVSGATKLGRVADLAAVEQQALARYTNDAGNHVTIELRTAPVLATG